MIDVIAGVPGDFIAINPTTGEVEIGLWGWLLIIAIVGLLSGD